MNNFKEVLQSLRKEKGLNQDELATSLGISRATVSDYERGRSQPDLDTLLKTATFFGISVDQLLGSVHPFQEEKAEKKRKNVHLNVHPTVHPTDNLNGSTDVNERMMAMYNRVPAVVTVDRSGNDSITYVPLRARAGYLAGFQDPEFISTLPTYSFPGMQNATFRMWEIEGHSMIPTFDDSDIIIGRFIENLSQIRNDRVHIVVTKNDGILIKRVLNRSVTDGKLILNSDNQKDPRDYPPIVIGVEEVLEVWYGVAKFTRQMRAPGEMYNKLIDLEARLTLLEHSKRT